MKKRIAESELIINSDGTVFHLHVKPEELADKIIFVGDPERVDMVAASFDEGSIETVRSSREFKTITGRFNGVRVSAISHGIGTDNIDIVMTEVDALANIDFATRLPKDEHRRLQILRIGTCGAIRPEIPLGGYIFSEMCIGFDGLLNWYRGVEEYSDRGAEEAFLKHFNWPERLPRPYFIPSAKSLSKRFDGVAFKGMTMSAPGFYGPQGRAVRLTPAIPDLIEKLETFSYNGLDTTNIEMENSAIAGMSAMLGHDSGTVCLAIANRHAKESNPDYKPLMEGLIRLSLEKLTE